MLKSILVPIDGSQACETARDWAIQLARRTGARLTGLGVLDEPTITHPSAAPIGGMTSKVSRDHALLNEAERRIQVFLERFETACRAAGLEPESLRERIGVPYEQIAWESHRHDLIVLASETHFHFETQDEPGDTLERIVQGTPRPMMVIPSVVPDGTGCVVAYDGRLPAARTLQAFVTLGFAGETPVQVVTVDEDADRASELCHLAVDYLAHHGIEAEARPVVSGESLTAAFRDQLGPLRPRYVCIGAHSGGKLRKLFFGSFCKEVLADSPVPVFVYH